MWMNKKLKVYMADRKWQKICMCRMCLGTIPERKSQKSWLFYSNSSRNSSSSDCLDKSIPNSRGKPNSMILIYKEWRNRISYKSRLRNCPKSSKDKGGSFRYNDNKGPKLCKAFCNTNREKSINSSSKWNELSCSKSKNYSYSLSPLKYKSKLNSSSKSSRLCLIDLNKKNNNITTTKSLKIKSSSNNSSTEEKWGKNYLSNSTSKIL